MVDYYNFFENTTINYYQVKGDYHNKQLEDFHMSGMHEYSVIEFTNDRNIGSNELIKEFCVLTINQINSKHLDSSKR